MADVDNTPAGDPDDFGTEVKSHPIGDLASAMIDVIEAEYGESATIGLVGIVAQVSFPVGTGTETTTCAWSNVDPSWVQAALFEEGARATRGESS